MDCGVIRLNKYFSGNGKDSCDVERLLYGRSGEKSYAVPQVFGGGEA